MVGGIMAKVPRALDLRDMVLDELVVLAQVLRTLDRFPFCSP